MKFNPLTLFKALSITLPALMAAGPAAAQHTRYKDPVFKDITVEENISYLPEGRPGVKQKSFDFDLYQPQEDNAVSRPLIIWFHGGGFKYGSKKADGMKIWSRFFAERGWVCAAANYRLSKDHPLSKFHDLVEACRDACEDANTAVAFFRKNKARFRIDPNKIFLAGNSAGGIISLQAVYASTADLNELIGKKEGSRAHNPEKVAGIINFWGGTFNPGWLANARVPIVSAHGTKDKLVPYYHEKALWGSLAIHLKADTLRIPNGLKSYEGYSHELQKHFNPFIIGKAAKDRWKEAAQFSADFLYENCLGRSE